jgi:hypothetical protein
MNFDQQGISNILWSFATLNVKDELLFQSSYTITILVVSFGLFDFRHDGFFHEVATEVLNRTLWYFGYSPLGVLRWTFSKYPIQYPEFIEAIDAEAYCRDILMETVTFVPDASILLETNME